MRLFKRKDRRPKALVRQFDNSHRWLLVNPKTNMPIGSNDYETADTAAWSAERQGYRPVFDLRIRGGRS